MEKTGQPTFRTLKKANLFPHDEEIMADKFIQQARDKCFGKHQVVENATDTDTLRPGSEVEKYRFAESPYRRTERPKSSHLAGRCQMAIDGKIS
jgi:hypothetical protein